MKLEVAFCVYAVLASAVLSCPDEINCRACYKPPQDIQFCFMCENSFWNLEKYKCDTNIVQPVANCARYGEKSDGSKTVQCIECTFGYTLDNNTCVKCEVEGCAVCTIDQACWGCFDSRRLIVNTVDMKKSTCSKDQKCSVLNCDICELEGSELCRVCKPGFNVQRQNRMCVAFLANCQMINGFDARTCYVCNPGFYITATGSCVENTKPGPSKPDEPKTWGWLWVVPVQIVLVVGGYFAYNHFAKDRNQIEPVYLIS